MILGLGQGFKEYKRRVMIMRVKIVIINGMFTFILIRVKEKNERTIGYLF